MREFENHVQYIKYSILKEIIGHRLQGGSDIHLMDIPKTIIPGPEAGSRCCIYKERAIVGERMKVNMGESTDGNEERHFYMKVVDMACDDCSVAKYVVTDACRGCLAHRCLKSCRFGAINIVNQRAVIDPDKCTECGKCATACPYNAIVEVLRPCIKACPVGAIDIHPDTKKASIREEDCIQCGACAYQCPFGAIIDHSDILSIVEELEKAKDGGDRVYAIIAPAIVSQFTYASIEQIVAGLKKLGFHTAVEAAVGADIIAWHETKQVVDELEHLDFVASSCCPAFVEMIRKHEPRAIENMSKAVSPMVATGRLIKESDANCKTVFIGPCIAKKAEARLSHVADAVDYVMTFEELQAWLDAVGIDVGTCEGVPLDNASYYGRLFARVGGLSEAVAHVAGTLETDIEVKAVQADGAEACRKMLESWPGRKAKRQFPRGYGLQRRLHLRSCILVSWTQGYTGSGQVRWLFQGKAGCRHSKNHEPGAFETGCLTFLMQ